MIVEHFQQQGNRPYQEDYYLISPDKKLFIVCDGMGGHARGDLAARISADTIFNYLANNKDSDKETVITEAVNKASIALHEYVLQHPEAEGMGCTMCMLYFHEGGLICGHIGDSRVYFLRKSIGRYWRTKDHSMVQELFDAGVLNSELEMRTHPQNSRISRALVGKQSLKPVKIEIQLFQELRSEDTFLLCSDGVIEALNEKSLLDILTDANSQLADKSELIRQNCDLSSRDNQTAILIELEEADARMGGRNSHEWLETPSEFDIIDLDEEDYTEE